MGEGTNTAAAAATAAAVVVAIVEVGQEVAAIEADEVVAATTAFPAAAVDGDPAMAAEIKAGAAELADEDDDAADTVT